MPVVFVEVPLRALPDSGNGGSGCDGSSECSEGELRCSFLLHISFGGHGRGGLFFDGDQSSIGVRLPSLCHVHR